jgi:Zn finger protein HypA/HybF involved in hydrogenase expression
MHEGCSGQFQNGQQVADKVRMMGYDTVALTVPLTLACVQCQQPFSMETMVTQCPECRMVYAVTPCHADSVAHVRPAGIDY